jgi:hypothetical protein
MSPTWQHSRAEASRQIAERLLAGRASRFSERIWLGNLAAMLDPHWLQSQGITAACNLSRGKTMLAEVGLHCLNVEQDDGAAIEDKTLEEFLAWMDDAWIQGHTILVACAAGVSRTPSFLIAWLLHNEGVHGSGAERRWDELEVEVRSCRAFIAPHPLLKASVLGYLQKENRNDPQVPPHRWRASVAHNP